MQRNHTFERYKALNETELMAVNGGRLYLLNSYFDIGRYYGNAFRDLTFGFIYGFIFGM
ncbi:hypothetical protein G6R29_05270 [Fructobacillus sp. M2-14]|uniref:Uncharacterized protein n=1 Tax=Fructobacillus broussonetiae TaxID=2713173 RepID=A0ABS5R0S0_9LACO|nr:hypothetical protein [Fructobacillus broussonetiae]MBS9339030.1 hypothetical protein [Fructobacillus broussonetiae]